MMTIRLLVSAAVLLTASFTVSGQPTVTLEGRLIHLEGRETGQVNLSFGPFGTTLTRSDGFFTHAVPGGTDEVTVQVEDNGWTVLFPRNGRIAVPRGEDVVVEIVAGDPIEDVITRTLAEKHQRLLSELTTLGAEQEQIRVVLESFLNEVRTRMDVDEAAFREALDLAGERRERYPEIAATLKDYVLKAQNFYDAFRFLAEIAVRDPTVIRSIDSTLIVYNESFEKLNSRHSGFEQDVATYWQSERLAAEFSVLMDYALGEIHRSHLLRLNESIVGLHELRNVSGSERRERGAEISEDITRILDDLEPRLAELDTRTERTLQALFPE